MPRTVRTLPRVVAAAVLAGLLLAAAAGTSGGTGQPGPSPLAASPYEYLGWGDPPSPSAVMAATGIRDFTMSFILADGGCTPAWDGSRPLTGGVDQSAIDAIRAAGGDVVVSFGGADGAKLGNACSSPAALATAYEQVVATYGLHAIDIDIEGREFSDAVVRRRVVGALALLERQAPHLSVSLTMDTTVHGPNAAGRSLVADAAAAHLEPAVFTVMPFDFGPPVPADMVVATERAATGLAHLVAADYHQPVAVAWRHVGISSMNGRTDVAGETVELSDFEAIARFAATHHLGRLTFWAVNRDRPCGPASTGEGDCSGVAQPSFGFDQVLARYAA